MTWSADPRAVTAAVVAVLLASAPLAAPHGRGRARARGTPRRRRSRVVVVGASLCGVVAVVGPWAGAVAAAATGLVMALRRRTGALAVARDVRAAVPDAVELLLLTIRAGHPPLAAVRLAASATDGPAHEAFRAVVLRTERGERFADALGALTDHLGPEAAPVVDALGAAERDGVAIGPVLDELTAEARAARRRRAAADARTLPVRLAFPLVTCTLPAFVLLTVAPVLLATWASLAEPP